MLSKPKPKPNTQLIPNSYLFEMTTTDQLLLTWCIRLVVCIISVLATGREIRKLICLFIELTTNIMIAITFSFANNQTVALIKHLNSFRFPYKRPHKHAPTQVKSTGSDTARAQRNGPHLRGNKRQRLRVSGDSGRDPADKHWHKQEVSPIQSQQSRRQTSKQFKQGLHPQKATVDHGPNIARLPECMFSHSPSSASSSASSSFSSGQIYTSSSICSQSPSLTSTHSVAFNQMIDSFLNRFKTTPTTTATKKSKKSSKSLSTSSTSSSQSSLSVDSSLNSNSKASESANKATRLSVRVSNLTLEDLKLRQRMLCHQQQQQQQLQQSIVQYSWQTLQLMNNMNRNSCLVLGHCTSPVQV